MDEASASRAAYERVNRILRRFDRAYSSAATQVGLSDSALDVLWALYDAGEGCLQRDICAFSCLGKQTVNSSVHKLVKEGMLRLEPAQAGRGMRVFLTPAGRKLMESRVIPLCEADFAAFATLSPEDQAAAERVSQAYVEELERRFSELAAASSDHETARG